MKVEQHLELRFNMSTKTCIIIDDVNQNNVINTDIVLPLRKDAIDVHVTYINATDPDLLDDDSNICIEKLEAKLYDAFHNCSIDVVATDFDLSDDNINGKHIAEIAHKIRNNVPIIIYSGDRSKVVAEVIGDYKNMTSQNLIQKIINFKSLNLISCTERSGYPSEVIRQLKKKDTHTTSILLRNLREYSELQFKSCYPNFQGKSLGDIANEIERNTPQGLDFQNALLEQTIAYLININSDSE